MEITLQNRSLVEEWPEESRWLIRAKYFGELTLSDVAERPGVGKSSSRRKASKPGNRIENNGAEHFMNSLRYTGGSLQLLDDGKIKASWPATFFRTGAAVDGSVPSLQSGEYSLKPTVKAVLRFEWIGSLSSDTDVLKIVEIVSELPPSSNANQQYLQTTREAIEVIVRCATERLGMQVVYFDERFLKSTTLRIR